MYFWYSKAFAESYQLCAFMDHTYDAALAQNDTRRKMMKDFFPPCQRD